MVDYKYDFSGYATKSNLVCADGRTIKPDAFKVNDGQKVPLVWQHQHNDPHNVLGHALLENREDGVYAYCTFNQSDTGQQASELVKHGDINQLSIYANNLVEKAKIVHSGVIREVSLVLAGANPGAFIDQIGIAHADGDDSLDEAVIYTGLQVELAHSVEEILPETDEKTEESVETKTEEEPIAHAAATVEESSETVEDIIKTLSDKQKDVVFALIAKAATGGDAEDLSQSTSEGDTFMKKNLFENEETTETKAQPHLTHSQIKEIFADAQKMGSLKEAFLAHVTTYGIENIDYLFPDAKSVTPTPTFVQRDTRWVDVWMSGTKHSPFSRIKSLSADITLDTARALGYVKGALKKEEFFALSKRVTTPTTVYKKQKLDRDDLIDITELDVVAWMKAEMRMMLNEEVARACLLGDGREPEDGDKISETSIRPVYKDASLYVTHVTNPSDATVVEIMDSIVRARKDYKGSGNPVMFTTTDFLTDMLLVRDSLDRRIYQTMNDLTAALRVSAIVEVPMMEGVQRIDTTPTPDEAWDLVAILVNPSDYTIGADAGGQISMFDDFDIDYNQFKYLLETRVSGALVNPKTALVIEIAGVLPG